MAAKGKEITTTLPGFEDDGFLERSALDAFKPEDIKAFLTDLGLSAEDVEFKSSEYTPVDKDALTGVPLFLIEWEHKPSTKGNAGDLYALVFGVRMDNSEKILFSDSGVGINEQLKEITARRIQDGKSVEASTHGLLVPNGLRRSDYEANDVRPAGTTYYLG